jgi:cytochrome o ubiquinol oxidase subunit 3
MMASEASTISAVHREEYEHPDTVANHAFGFWIYLMTDLVLFAAIFATYAVLAHNYAGGPSGKDLFDLSYTLGETMLLLFSSATCGMAMLAIHKGRKKRVLTWLTLTILLGLGFISMEINEFYRMILDGNGPQRSGFLSAFFTLVGSHGAHVSFGLIWMAVMVVQVMSKGLTTPVQSRLMRSSMFWHFLDVVWIGVFTVVYLRGVL